MTTWVWGSMLWHVTYKTTYLIYRITWLTYKTTWVWASLVSWWRLRREIPLASCFSGDSHPPPDYPSRCHSPRSRPSFWDDLSGLTSLLHHWKINDSWKIMSIFPLSIYASISHNIELWDAPFVYLMIFPFETFSLSPVPWSSTSCLISGSSLTNFSFFSEESK